MDGRARRRGFARHAACRRSRPPVQSRPKLFFGVTAGLRLHPLTGKLEGMQAVSLTYSYRITLILQVTEHEILLLDISSHDEVFR